MRSRYSAFVLGLGDYLRETWHPRTRPTEPLVIDVAQRWLRLEIKQAPPAAGDQGTVTFVAVSKMGGRAHRLHECSRFVREGGRWYYLEGDILP
jgi:SEC-C motif domain protein